MSAHFSAIRNPQSAIRNPQSEAWYLLSFSGQAVAGL